MPKKDPSELLAEAAELLERGKHAKAAERCAKALAIKPSAGGFALMSQIATADGRDDDAIAALIAGAELEPRRREIWSRLATLYMAARRWDETAAAAARALALEPFESSARASAAIAAFERKQHAEAWYHWGVLDLTGDHLVANGVAIAIAGDLDDDDGDSDGAAGRAAGRAAADREFPHERANRELHVAVRRGDLDGVRASLAAGARPDAPNDERMTPLLVAADAGELEIVRTLLDAGADPNPLRVEVMFVAVLDTPLKRAKHHKHRKVVALLKERGAKEDKDLPDPMMLEVEATGTPHQRLLAALWADDLTRVERALADGADPNGLAHDDSERVLAAAVRLRKPAYVRALLAAGADANTRNGNDPLLFDWLIDDAQVECALALLEGGADPNVTAGKRTVLSSLPRDRKQKARYSRALLSHGLDPALRDDSGRTLLALVVDDGDDLELVDLLLTRGADPTIEVARTPLVEIAARSRGKAAKKIAARLTQAISDRATPA
jgi:ankyrin repeat protein